MRIHCAGSPAYYRFPRSSVCRLSHNAHTCAPFRGLLPVVLPMRNVRRLSPSVFYLSLPLVAPADLCAVLSTVFIRFHSRLSAVCRPSEVTAHVPCSHAARTPSFVPSRQRAASRSWYCAHATLRTRGHARSEVIHRLLYVTGAASHAFLSSVRPTSWWAGFLRCQIAYPDELVC
ncbi:hypothetical protein C8J57DRAFT_1323059, partial [Mycena rebaudengoi]